MPKGKSKKQRPFDASNPDVGIRPSEFEVPEEEQQRLINESDLFSKLAQEGEHQEVEQPPEFGLGDEIFAAITLIIPFTSLLILMDILVHQQYSQDPSIYREFERLVEVLPFLSIVIFFTNRHRRKLWCQAAMIIASIISGTRMVYVINKESYLRVMRQSPPLGTLWVYTIWQLDLLPAVFSLGVTFAWIRWRKLRIIFE